MADAKITDLTALTAANAATGDLLEIVDVSDSTMSASGTNKKVTVADLAGAVAKEGVVAADAVFDAKGDLAVGTGANTAAKLTVGANGTILVAASGETTGVKWAAPSGVGLFGDGNDGDVTISADTTLTSDMYYGNLTVNASTRLSTGGYRVFVRGTLTLNGTISHNGSNGSGTVAGNGATKGSIQSANQASGGAGGNTTGNNGTGVSVNCFGSAGGAGGTGASGAGGAAGTKTNPGAGQGGNRGPGNLWIAMGKVTYDENSTARAGLHGGTGAGGGGGDGSAGGGGGGGGGVCFVAAKTLAGTGTIEAKGGNGGTPPGGNKGGGGGGGGGVVILITQSASNPYTVSVAGGTGGGGTGTGTAGSDGTAGQTFLHLGVAVV